jgi:RimJ/RimL family protein N-acetyltransferase
VIGAELTTARLVLRPVADGDIDALWPFVSDPSLPRFMLWAAHRDRSETRAFVTAMEAGRAADRDLAFAIHHDGAAAGIIGLHKIRRTVGPCRFDRAELGYWLAPPLHGQGLMTEAGAAVLAYAFGPLGLHKLVTAHFVDNDASRRVIEKLGFRLVGRSDDEIYRDGRWHAQLHYELIGS